MTVAVFCRPILGVIRKKFGGYKKFLLVMTSLVLVLYTLKNLFVNDRREVWDAARSLSTNNTISNLDIKQMSADECDIKCLPDQFSFFIKSGEKTPESGQGPTICFQGKVYLSPELKNVARGFNVVLINSNSQAVKAVKTFDTYMEEFQFLRFLKREVKDEDILMLATFDDAANNLQDTGRHWITLFGSALISKMKFRDNFIMIGHRGLESGSAIEYYQERKTKKENGFAPAIVKAGCFSFPMGKRVDMKNAVPEVLVGEAIKKGPRRDNCGMTQPCPDGTVSVALETGNANLKAPSICVDGYVAIGDKVNDGGRGFNIVSLEPGTLKLKKVTHMDTYTYDSIDLELFLDSLDDQEIILAVIADDASKRLGQSARDSLNLVGSSQIQNLRFRDVWYFIGQKGIKGFSTMEEISFQTFDGGWPRPLAKKFCVPKILPSSEVMVENESKRNDPRRNFCLKYEGYTDFCNPLKVDEDLIPIETSDKNLKKHTIFETPIIIVPGLNNNAFVHTLETTILQPGINQDMVAVLYDEKLPEYGELTNLFGFRNYSLSSSVTYQEQLNKALKFARIVYSSAEHFIVIEEDLLLSPDFLPFMAVCIDTINLDSSLAGAFSWNVNGFEHLSGNSSLMYRVQEFPGMGFLIKTHVLQQLIDSLGNCCKNRAWGGWHLEVQGLEMLVPDVSRVYRTPFYGNQATSDFALRLFLKPRRTHLEVHPASIITKHLISSEYEEFLLQQVKGAQVLKPSVMANCMAGATSAPSLEDLSLGPVVIYFAQNSADDTRVLKLICQCFGLVALEDMEPHNLHFGLLRFYYHKHDMFLVGSMTRYFNEMVSSDSVVGPKALAAVLQ